MADVIRTDALTKRFGAIMALDGLDLRVPQGEVFGFLGPNGAGKTPTIRLLLDQIRPTPGRIEVLGLDARRDAVAIHARIGYLPGELALYPRMTGEDLVALLCALSGRSCHERTTQLASRFDLDLARPASPDVLAGVPGVHDVVVSGDQVRCAVEGAMAPMLRAVAGLDVLDLTSHEADLDQIFLQYYTERRDEVAAGTAGVAS